jgi:hypothetical protein
MGNFVQFQLRLGPSALEGLEVSETEKSPKKRVRRPVTVSPVLPKKSGYNLRQQSLSIRLSSGEQPVCDPPDGAEKRRDVSGNRHSTEELPWPRLSSLFGTTGQRSQQR